MKLFNDCFSGGGGEAGLAMLKFQLVLIPKTVVVSHGGDAKFPGANNSRCLCP